MLTFNKEPFTVLNTSVLWPERLAKYKLRLHLRHPKMEFSGVRQHAVFFPERFTPSALLTQTFLNASYEYLFSSILSQLSIIIK